MLGQQKILDRRRPPTPQERNAANYATPVLNRRFRTALAC
jgi:hypothetical protein